MNTKNAPERLEFKAMWHADVGPCLQILGKDWRPSPEMLEIADAVNLAMNAALQPQVSENKATPDAVELAQTIRDLMGGDPNGNATDWDDDIKQKAAALMNAWASEREANLRELLNEAKEEIRAYAVNEHPYADKYPSEALKLQRDMDIVLRIEAALGPVKQEG